jgi:hypothetical protein
MSSLEILSAAFIPSKTQIEFTIYEYYNNNDELNWVGC